MILYIYNSCEKGFLLLADRCNYWTCTKCKGQDKQVYLIKVDKDKVLKKFNTLRITGNDILKDELYEIL